MNLTTLQYRIKDSSCTRQLSKMAGSVSYVWNYCNEVNYDCWRKFRKTYTAFDLNKKTKGCGKELGLHSQTVQAVAEEYAKASKQFSKPKLKWRSAHRSLGWIPFKTSGVRVAEDSICYQGRTYRFWL